jgi:hypothetical protein
VVHKNTTDNPRNGLAGPEARATRLF